MHDERQLDAFEQWLQEEISGIQLDDTLFTAKVLRKLVSDDTGSTRATDWWTVSSWVFCTVTLGSLLLQKLMQVDADSLTGPVGESLLLLIAMMAASWQCQRTWVHEP